MKKIILFFMVMLLAFSFVACESKDKLDNDTNNTEITNRNSDEETKTTTKVKLLGDIAPKPSKKYDIINTSEDNIYLVVKNANEDDFRDYVESCQDYGFDGYIKSATTPTLYFREYNEEDYYLEVNFYEDDGKFSVYIKAPNN